jgi:hypothetical protein
MTVRLVIPYDTDTLEAGEWEVYDVDFCSSLECAGEVRPVEYGPDGCSRCLSCGTVWDPSEGDGFGC